jgi:hypothetical protein
MWVGVTVFDNIVEHLGQYHLDAVSIVGAKVKGAKPSKSLLNALRAANTPLITLHVTQRVAGCEDIRTIS